MLIFTTLCLMYLFKNINKCRLCYQATNALPMLKFVYIKLYKHLKFLFNFQQSICIEQFARCCEKINGIGLQRTYSFIYVVLERMEGREKERDRNINVWLPLTHPQVGTWSTTQACAVTRNRNSNTLVRRPALNPLSHTSQG